MVHVHVAEALWWYMYFTTYVHVHNLFEIFIFYFFIKILMQCNTSKMQSVYATRMHTRKHSKQNNTKQNWCQSDESNMVQLDNPIQGGGGRVG